MTDEDNSRNYVASCVSCGGAIRVTNGVYGRHECSKRHDGAQKSADTRSYDDVPTRRNLTFGQRLAMGFELLADNDPKDEDEE